MGKSFACDECTSKYRNRNDLVAHRKQSHSTAPNYTCRDCGQEFVWKKELTAHCKTMHGLPTFICDICSKECYSNPSLRYHKQTHTRPYQCKLCPRAFYQIVQFSKHMVTKHNMGINMIQANMDHTLDSNSVYSDDNDMNNNQSESLLSMNVPSCIEDIEFGADSVIAVESNTSDQSCRPANQSTSMQTKQLNGTHYTIGADSMTNANELNASHQSFRRSPINHSTSISQLPSTDSTDGANELNSNCPPPIDLPGPIVMSSPGVPCKVEKSCSTLIDNHKNINQPMLQPVPNNHTPSTGKADTQVRQTTTIEPISCDDDFDTSFPTSPNYMPSPEYFPVGPFGFKDFYSSKDIDSTPSDYSTVREQDNEHNDGMSVKDSVLLKVDEKTCSDKQESEQDLDKCFSSASDEEMYLDGDVDDHNSDHPPGVLCEKPSNDSKLSEIIGFKDIALIDNSGNSTTSEPLSLTSEPQTAIAGNTNNEVPKDQVRSSDIHANIDNRCVSKKETSDLEANQEKCVTPESLTRNVGTYACKVCQVIFKDILTFAVHEMTCSQTSDIAQVFSGSECSSIIEEGSASQNPQMEVWIPPNRKQIDRSSKSLNCRKEGLNESEISCNFEKTFPASYCNKKDFNENEVGTVFKRKQTYIASNSHSIFSSNCKKEAINEIAEETLSRKRTNLSSNSQSSIPSSNKKGLDEMGEGLPLNRKQIDISTVSKNNFAANHKKQRSSEIEVGTVAKRKKANIVPSNTESSFLSYKRQGLCEIEVETSNRKQIDIPSDFPPANPISFHHSQRHERLDCQTSADFKPSKTSCDQTFDQQEETNELEEILDDIHKIINPEIFQCIHCAMKFRFRLEHHKHELSHELAATMPTGVTYICIVCGNSFDMTDNLIEHVACHEVHR